MAGRNTLSSPISQYNSQGVQTPRSVPSVGTPLTSVLTPTGVHQFRSHPGNLVGSDHSQSPLIDEMPNLLQGLAPQTWNEAMDNFSSVTNLPGGHIDPAKWVSTHMEPSNIFQTTNPQKEVVTEETETIQDDTHLDETTLAITIPEVDGFLTMVPSGYPSPHILKHSPHFVNLLNGTEDLRLLAPFAAEHIINSGVYTMKTRFGSTRLFVSEQVRMNIAGTYYSTLPHVGYDARSFRLIHFVMATERGSHINSQTYADVQSIALVVATNCMTALVLSLGEILLKPEAKTATDLTATMSEAECVAILDEIVSTWRVVYGVYKMVYHLCHGGIVCISPIVDLIKNNPMISLYVDTISKGSESLLTVPAVILARSTTLPSARYEPVTITASKESRPTFVGESSGSPAPVQNKSRGPPILSAQGLINQSTMSGTTIPKDTSSQQYNTVDIEIPTSLLTDILPTQDNPYTLLNQAQIGKTTVVRNTTAFREGIQYSSNQDAAWTTILTSLEKLLAFAESSTRQMSQMEQRINKLDESLNILLTRGSFSDLANTSRFNTTILPPSGKAAQEAIASSPHILDIASSKMASLIERVRAFESEVKDPGLCNELKTLLSEHGHPTVAASITASAFHRSGFKTRLINKLNMLPVSIMK